MYVIISFENRCRVGATIDIDRVNNHTMFMTCCQNKLKLIVEKTKVMIISNKQTNCTNVFNYINLKL